MDIDQIYKQLDRMFEQGQTREAEDFLIACMKRAQALGDYNALVMLLNEMIGYCRETSQKEKSLAYSAQVIELMQQLAMTDSVAYATTLLNVANACRAAGKLQEAYQFYMEVFPLYERLLAPNDFYYAGLYNNLSLLFQETGEYERAVECLEKALVIAVETEGKEFEVAVTHTNLAATLCKLAEQADEEERALQVNKMLLGYDKGRQLAGEALLEAREAIKVFEGLEVADVHMAAAQAACADALVLLGRGAEAKNWYERALLLIERAVGVTEGYHRVEEKLAHTERLLQAEQEERTRTAMPAQAEKAKSADGADTAETSMSGLAISRAYFETYGKKMLFDDFNEYLGQIAVGLCGEGSDCLGYDDAYSADHDFGPGFAIWVSDETYRMIGRELEMAYARLPKEFMGFERVESEQAKGRCGVSTFSQYFERVIGLNKPPVSQAEWLYVDESALRAAVSGEIFCDPQGIFTAMQEQVKAYYPENVWRRKLAQEMTCFSQNGQYNYERMTKRGDLAAANLLLMKAAESAIHLVYLLNRQYRPHTKWLLRGLEDCDRLPMAVDLITGILHEIGSRGELEKVQKLTQIEKLAGLLLEELKAQQLLPFDAEDTYLAAYAQQIAYGSGQQKQVTAWPTAEQTETQAKTPVVETVEMQAKTPAVETAETQAKTPAVETAETQAKDLADETAGNMPQSYTKQELVDALVHMEWKAFDKVKNEGGRADCQDDWQTFRIMRQSQYQTWTEEMLAQYIYDFRRSMDAGWNPITEKYARMMESTAPDSFEQLRGSLKEVSPQKREIIEEIIKIQVDWMEDFSRRYPKMAKSARRIHTEEDTPYDTSYETYLRGELKTYSDEMLELYGRFIVSIAIDGGNLAEMTMEQTAYSYGYHSLAEAEEKMW